MRFLPLKVILVLLLAAAPAFSCECVNPPGDVKTPGDVAAWHAAHADEVFEGTVSSIEPVWTLLSAHVGDVIPADLEEDLPHMLVTFQVSRTFKGGQRTQVQVETGLGGGDCGFRFEVGGQYLVYADLDNKSGELSTNICSGTATVDESRPAIAKLSGERPSSETAAPTVPRTGKLCVRLAQNPLPAASYQIYLYETGGNSFIPADEAELQRNGSFCASDLKPRKYFLLLLDDTAGLDSSVSIAFYPGVAHVSDASPIEVKAGESVSGLQFRVPPSLTHSVSGSIRAKNASKLPEQVLIELISAEASEFRFPYVQGLGQDGSFRFPKVLPGKYWAIATTVGEGSSNWSTRKVDVDVDGNVTGLSLELIPKK